MSTTIVNRQSKIVNGNWLPDIDLNYDKQIQSLLCYRYTIGQTDASGKLENFGIQSSWQTVKALPNLVGTVRLRRPRGLAAQRCA